MIAAALKPPPGDVELNAAVFLVLDQLSCECRQLLSCCRAARLQFVQQLPALLVVDRTTIVRIDQAQIPQLRPLIEIRHTGGCDLDQRLCQGIEETNMTDARLKPAKILQEAGA